MEGSVSLMRPSGEPSGTVIYYRTREGRDYCAEGEQLCVGDCCAGEHFTEGAFGEEEAFREKGSYCEGEAFGRGRLL